jgi:hypothetical protein
MRRGAAVFLCTLLSACSARQGSGVTDDARPRTSEDVAALDDSVRALVASYEVGAVSLTQASNALADLVEPTGGLAVQPAQSARAQELFQATGRELRRREAEKYGSPDSPGVD